MPSVGGLLDVLAGVLRGIDSGRRILAHAADGVGATRCQADNRKDDDKTRKSV